MQPPAAAANQPSTPIEVEVKLRLHSAADHDRVAALFADRRRATYAQENYFFDGANEEFSSRRTIVRVRLYNTDEKATLTVKVGSSDECLYSGPKTASPIDPSLSVYGWASCRLMHRFTSTHSNQSVWSQYTHTTRPQGEAILVDGISTVPEQEEPLEPSAAREIVQQPAQLLQLPSAMFSKLLQYVTI